LPFFNVCHCKSLVGSKGYVSQRQFTHSLYDCLLVHEQNAQKSNYSKLGIQLLQVSKTHTTNRILSKRRFNGTSNTPRLHLCRKVTKRAGKLANVEDRGLLGNLAPVFDITCAQRLIEAVTCIQNLDMHRATVTGEDHGQRDRVRCGSDEVIRVATHLCHVEGRFAASTPFIERFEKIKFTAARFPARATVVLAGPRNMRVQRPDSRHIELLVELASLTLVAGDRHGELHQEGFLRTAKAICAIT